MGIRAKMRHSSTRRGGTAVAARPAHPKRAVELRRHQPDRHPNHYSAPKNGHNGVASFSQALRFLSALSDYERLRIVRYNSQNFDLERMRTLLKRLGNPQSQFKSVHIAGTKGKGSTCAMIGSMLHASGYKVGVYSSPHLVDIRERIQINGEMISQAEFV